MYNKGGKTFDARSSVHWANARLDLHEGEVKSRTMRKQSLPAVRKDTFRTHRGRRFGNLKNILAQGARPAKLSALVGF